jgi:hypothetical protein
VIDRTYQFEVCLKTPERTGSQIHVAVFHRGVRRVVDSSTSLTKSIQLNDPFEEISTSQRTSVWDDRASTAEKSMVFLAKSKKARDLWVARIANLLHP